MRPHRWTVAVTCIALAWSCRTATAPGGAGAGSARVLLTDAPPIDASVARVVAYIDHIDASASADSGNQTWTTLVAPHQKYDLLTLQNGTMALLGTASLPPAEIREIRVAMNTDSSGVFRTDGSQATVHWGYAGSITVHVLVETPLQVLGANPQILLDFNVANSFVTDPSDATAFNFLPWIRATTM